MPISAECHNENLAKVTILIWRLTYSMCIFGWQLKRYLNLVQDLQMSRFISLCSLWDDGIMVGGMTVVSIMHKVRVCRKHLCKLRLSTMDGGDINENAHFRVAGSLSSLPPGFRKVSGEKARQRRTREILTLVYFKLFLCLGTPTVSTQQRTADI